MDADRAFFYFISSHFLVIHRGWLNTEEATSQLQRLKEGDTLILLAVERYDQQNVEAAE